MAYEHDSCKGCAYIDKEVWEQPCSRCKWNQINGTDEYEKAPDLYAPEGTHDDAVNHPSHYTQGGIECIDAMQAAFGAAELATYCKIAAFKYIWRCEHKGGLEDVKKAIWYLEKFIELEGGSSGEHDQNNGSCERDIGTEAGNQRR